MATTHPKTPDQSDITHTPAPNNDYKQLGALATLPLELRRRIYTYILPFLTSKSHLNKDAPAQVLPTTRARTDDPLGIQRTSRQIYEEIAALLYAGRTLIFDITPASREQLHIRLEHAGSRHAIYFPPMRWMRPQWSISFSNWLRWSDHRSMPFERLRGIVVEIYEPEVGDIEWAMISYIGVRMARKILESDPARLRVVVVAHARGQMSRWSAESVLAGEFPVCYDLPGGDLGMVLAPLLFGLNATVDVHALPAVTGPLEESEIRRSVKSVQECRDEECLIAGGRVLRIETDDTAGRTGSKLGSDSRKFATDRNALDRRVEEAMWRFCDEMMWGPYGKTLRNSWIPGFGFGR